ncbi:HilA family transcriptional regulator YgeH [Escherichia coli]|uniref:HilA family transcriptional regulator YgeH n=1 Tax=Escherichia coli TaxID=562 RepID=UPI00259CA2F5|nr:HilA family transcriptional regulator YgeH [Escherichia coli]EEZ2539838.1 HilA family transcriptional regulator YgeH [Escherichia coli]MBZ9501109.1 HilA family transcriptional regulator YgeH [Escherichia coli]MDM4906845.1 HilA family transcriptional regulator YgeH [Escherichia coli]MDM4924284.1 HilA family transcriptional regulator YgeH [Escherichia coli]MDM4950916.1 HilA family transcriptional regulator YgeH [Escherichia coli]
MDLENKFSYHFLEGLTLTEDGILTQGNEQVYIPQKELGVLIVLLESAGHVVLKDMIIESVWKNIIVSDESLTRCIYSLRCIFEKIGYDRCIETIYRKGYRFSGQVFKTKINEDNTSDYSIAIFPFTTSLNTLDPLILNQELVQIISNKKIDGLYTYPMAATNFCNDHISQNSFLSRFKPDYFVTRRINQNNAVNTLYIELIDAKNLFLIASNHLPVDELHNTSQFIIDNILQTVHKPERSVRLAKQDQGYKNHYLSDEMLAGKKELYDFTPESIYRAMTIFDRLQNKSDIQTLKTECYCLLAECHMSLALHGKSELELAAQKALELLDYVSDITTVDGKILAIMGLITGLSGQAKVSHILFEQAKIHSTDIASLYYYRALVHFHNEKVEEARICIDKSLQLEPRRRKAVVIKECVDMYVPNPLKNNIKLYYKETENESHRVIIDNILKLKQLTRICMR